MANIKSAIKRAKQNNKLREQNGSARAMFRTFVKNVVKAINTGNKEAANIAYHKAQSVIDKTAQKGLIHKNKADRLKHRLVIRLKAMAG